MKMSSNGDRTTTLQSAARLALGAALVGAGTGHLTFARDEFQAQVPRWIPVDHDLVVLGSGVVEIGLGLWLASGYRRRLAGWVAAGFFVAVAPGNIAQYLEGNDGLGLDTDRKRLLRLPFQPVLVAWALWSTGAWRGRPHRPRTQP